MINVRKYKAAVITIANRFTETVEQIEIVPSILD
jgi:hypothetical protein